MAFNILRKIEKMDKRLSLALGYLWSIGSSQSVIVYSSVLERDGPG
jgi:hypothetical protein